MKTLFEIYDAAFDSSADQEIIRAIKNKEDAAQYVKEYAAGAFGIKLSGSDAIQIAEVHSEWETRMWDPDYEAQYDRIVREQLDTEAGKLGCQYSDDLGWQHPYTTFTCPKCGRELCWSCGVRCTNDSTGEGYIECPCGHSAEYK